MVEPQRAPAEPAAAPTPPSAPPSEPAAAAPARPTSAAAGSRSTASPPAQGGGNHEFLALSASSYVIELAHGSDKSRIDALRTSLQLPRGALYDVHVSRDGADWWLLVWGTFDGVDAARAARAELPSDGSINAGWPRLVAPLQNEARRTGE